MTHLCCAVHVCPEALGLGEMWQSFEPECCESVGHTALLYTTVGRDGKEMVRRGGTGWVGTLVGQCSCVATTSKQAAHGPVNLFSLAAC